MNPTPRQCIRILDAYDAGIATIFEIGGNRCVLSRKKKGGRLEVGSVSLELREAVGTKNGGIRFNCEDGTVVLVSPSKEAKQ